MQVQFNSDNQTDGSAAMAGWVDADLQERLKRFGERITRVEVHLSDVNAQRSGPADKRCMIEARPAGRRPIAVTHEAESVDRAVAGATDKLVNAIDRTFGRSTGRKGH